MTQYVLSTILFFVGLDMALCLLAVNIILLKKERQKLPSLLDSVVALVFGGYSVWALVRQYSGIACAMVSTKGLVLYVLLLLLHAVFLLESFRRVRAIEREKGEKHLEQ